MLRKSSKVVLVGGCFDILHPGHLIFLEKAKKEGDQLIVLLESDAKIRKLKGEGRPVNTQEKRAKALRNLKFVTQVLELPFMETEKEYEQLIQKIKPDVIAITRGIDEKHHKRVAKLTGATLKYVTEFIKGYSTTKIISHNKGL